MAEAGLGTGLRTCGTPRRVAGDSRLIAFCACENSLDNNQQQERWSRYNAIESGLFLIILCFDPLVKGRASSKA
jgi:hypothetical protein